MAVNVNGINEQNRAAINTTAPLVILCIYPIFAFIMYNIIRAMINFSRGLMYAAFLEYILLKLFFKAIKPDITYSFT